jgi:hypothetical protein
VLALGRNGWWVMNFIYTPIYVANAGYRPEIGGALVSLGLAPMLLVRVWGRIGQTIGARNLLTVGYGLIQPRCGDSGRHGAFGAVHGPHLPSCILGHSY